MPIANVFLAIKPFLLGVKTSGFKLKFSYIECNFPIRHKLSINFLIVFRVLEAEIGTIIEYKKPNLFNDLKKGVFSPEQSNTS